MNNKNTPIPYLAEMVDSYVMLHNDYLNTSLFDEATSILEKLQQIESQMIRLGCNIVQQTEEWETYLYKLPEMEAYLKFGTKELIMEAKSMSLESKNFILIDILRKLENAILKEAGKRKAEKAFYSQVQIMQQIEDNVVIKQVSFNDYDFYNFSQNLIGVIS